MRPRPLSQIAEVCGGHLVGVDVQARSVVIDSRDAGPGSLFFALRGEQQDGHAFVTDALDRGAAGAVVSSLDAVSEPARVDGPLVVVESVIDALQDLAADERRGAEVSVVGITGSTGKTTTKDLLRAVVESRFVVQAAPGSFNNEIGLPLTILGVQPEHEVIITEMGARGVGHIAGLARIAQPDVGIVTNVGVAHLELFGSVEAIAQAKGELVEALPSTGHAILNDDDPVVRTYADRTEARVWRFGAGEGVDVGGTDLTLDNQGEARFTLEYEGQRVPVHIATPGAHMMSNALAAVAAGLSLGIGLPEAVAALESAEMSAWRMETFTNGEGIIVINDAYNANPTSMEAALKAARWISRESRLCAVLGTMRELGPISLQEHERVGELAARLRVERVVAAGLEARPIADAAVREGVEPDQVAAYEDPADALVDVKSWARPGDVVLFKGSRAVGLERLAEAMR